MDLSKIISITGKSGLHRVIGQNKQALIVESLADNKRFAVPLSVRVSSLEEISMFTTGDDVPLKDVLTQLHEANKGKQAADPKSDDATLWEALTQALPTADRERIYSSDVRKLFTWYGQLLAAGEFEKKEEAAKPAEHKEDSPKKAPAKAAKKKADAGAKVKPSSGGAPKAATVRRGGQRGS